MEKNKRSIWFSVISLVLILACVLGIFAVLSEPVDNKTMGEEDVGGSDTNVPAYDDSLAILSTSVFWTGSGAGGMVSYDCLYANGEYDKGIDIVKEYTSISVSGVVYRFYNHCDSTILVCATEMFTDDESEVIFQIYPGGQMTEFVTFEAGKTYFLYSMPMDSSDLPG